MIVTVYYLKNNNDTKFTPYAEVSQEVVNHSIGDIIDVPNYGKCAIREITTQVNYQYSTSCVLIMLEKEEN